MDLASRIDHTVLKADCSKEDIKKLCEEAQTHQFFAVCVPPYFTKLATDLLKDSVVKVATVVGFPLGYSATAAKVEEIKRGINDGADELDIVVNVAAVRDENWAYVKNDIDSVTRAAHLKGKIVKIIFEIGLLTNEEVKKLCEICKEVEVDYIRTSTDYVSETGLHERIIFLKKELGDSIKINASGGVHSKTDALKMLEVGAERLGSNVSVDIVSE